jgi:hypothetical protein
MATPIKDHRRLADHHGLRPVHAAADTTQRATTQRVQDLMVQLVREGQDASLRSLQVWADLARKLGPDAQCSPAGSTVVSFAYDPFEKLLVAQRQVVDELVATQRQLAQQLFETTAIVSNDLGPR